MQGYLTLRCEHCDCFVFRDIWFDTAGGRGRLGERIYLQLLQHRATGECDQNRERREVELATQIRRDEEELARQG